MKKNKRCDIIIPVYKSPEWVKLCVYSLFKNTDDNLLGRVYLINDCDDYLTKNLLINLKRKYSKITLLNNYKNLGFIKSVNKGLKESKSDYVLLLNTDCIIAKNTIGKLINHIEKNQKIGLICPVSSNAANLTLNMFDGFTYMQMDNLLEKKFKGKNFNACTVVGNCLMITRECINKVGPLDEAYGTGYGEETDYQFKAMKEGFEAKVAIDTYVFHKSEVSFGTTKEKQEKLEKNRKLFFDRWGNDYNKLMSEYVNNDPIKYIMDNLTQEDKKNKFKFLLYLIGFTQNAGGVHISVDMINYLAINGFDCNILYGFSNGYNEILLFNPIETKDIGKYKFDYIVSTIYSSAYYGKYLADKYNVPLIYFAQGYEAFFENGSDYGVVELSYKLADKILTISSFLNKKYKDTFKVNSNIIENGINCDLLYNNVLDKTNVKTITMVARGNYLKGDFILFDILKKIINECSNLEINFLYSNKYIKFPFNDNESIKINYLCGPFERKQISDIMQKSDLYIDTSLTEGFGLMALEAMAAGNVPIVSDSGGINEYIKSGYNGFIIKDVNNTDAYLEKIKELLGDKNKYIKILKNSNDTALKYDYDNIIDKYIKFFNQKIIKNNIILNENEKNLFEFILNNKYKITDNNISKKIIYKLCKKIPKSVRIKVKKMIEKLYRFTNER